MRLLFDKILRAGIKLCLLTGVSFLVTACYGTPYVPDVTQDEYEQDLQQMEQVLQKDSL